MWNRNKKEDEVPVRPAAQPAAPPPPVQQQQQTPKVQQQPPKEGTPMSTQPMRNFDPPSQSSSGGSATIGKAVMVKGQIYSREDLVIDGEVEGTVELQEHRLTVGPNGKVSASVKARELVVLGTIHGNVEITDKIDIRKEAKLVGDIRTARIIIEDGAYLQGNTDIVRIER